MSAQLALYLINFQAGNFMRGASLTGKATVEEDVLR